MGYSHSSLRLQIKHIYINIMFAATQQIASVAGLKATKVQSKSISTTVKADIYPEFGTYPGGGESPIIPFGNEKNAEREVIHGRWAILGVTGAWAAENGTGIPWFTAGTLCTPDDCTAVAGISRAPSPRSRRKALATRPSGTFS